MRYPLHSEAKARHLKLIEADSGLYTDALWTIIQENPERYLSGELSEQEVVREIRERSKPHFDRYVDTVYAAHRSVRHGFEEVFSLSIWNVSHSNKHPPTWDFMSSLFFTATMLTSIGYDYVCPSTFEGRLFGVLYCLIGWLKIAH